MDSDNMSTDITNNRYLFKYICLATVLTAAQGGAVPSVLDLILEDFNMSTILLGLLGGSVYMGLSLACPLTGHLFRTYSIKPVLITAVVCFLLLLVTFALTPIGYEHVLIILMGALGFMQAFLMVFSPVWLDEFSPEDTRTKWMAYLQAMTPFGIMFGYVLGAAALWLYPEVGPFGIQSWRLPFLAQAVLLLPLAVAALWIPFEDLQIDMGTVAELSPLIPPPPVASSGTAPSEKLQHETLIAPAVTGNTRRERARSRQRTLSQESSSRHSRKKRSSSVAFNVQLLSDNPLKTTKQATTRARLNSAFVYNDPAQASHWGIHLWHLCCNPVYSLIVLTLSGLYFVVTGIQFWGTSFLLLYGPQQTVHLLFILTSATAPVLGVFAGGAVCDKIGGYRVNPLGTLRTAMSFGACAGACAVTCTYVNSLYLIVACLWGLLFFGGGIVPACTGLFISSVPSDQRAFASSVSVIVFNILGYGFSPILTGMIMDAMSFKTGFHVCLLVSIGPLILLAMANVYVQQQHYASLPDLPEEEDEYQDDYSNVTYIPPSSSDMYSPPNQI